MPEPLLVKPKTTPEQANMVNKELQLEDFYGEVFEDILGKETIGRNPNLTAYQDSNKKWTIGIGHLIGDGSTEAYKKSEFYQKKITPEKAVELAKKDVKSRTDLIRRQIGQDLFDSYSPELRKQLASASYRGDINNSKKTLALLKTGKFEEAASEYLDHKEYRRALQPDSTNRGIAPRMEAVAAAIRNEGKKKKASFQDAVEERLNNSKMP